MNNENSNNGLNAISLGSVDNLGTTPSAQLDNGAIDTLSTSVAPLEPVAPIPPVNPIPEPSLDNNANNGIIEPAPVTNNQINEPINPNVDNNTVTNNGIINAVPPIEPVAPVDPISSTEPVPPLEPVAPIYDVSETLNNFNAAPVFNDIGTVPPIPNVPVEPVPIIAEPAPSNGDNNKSKRGSDKLLFVIIVVLALTAVGVGVYIFLGLSNNVTKGVAPKNVKLEIGSDIPSDINDYATFTRINSSSCSLDVSAIKSTSVLNAEYPFTISCEDKSYNGTVTIVDTVAPIAELKEVTAGVNDEIKVDDFIASCTDKSKCTYEFKDEAAVKGYTSNTGSYKVDIIVKDEAGNTSEVQGSLIVDGAAANLYLVCTKSSSELIETTKLGLDSDNVFIKTAIRNYTYTLSEADYMAFKNENSGKTEATYNGVTGSFTLDDANRSITISTRISYDHLVAEAGETVPLEYNELKKFYQNNGYSCRPGQ